MDSQHAIRSFLQICLPTFVTGYLLTFLTQDDTLQFFEAIMTLFLSGGRFTSKAKHITEDPLKSHLLTYFKIKFKNMTSALPAFFKLNKVYREILFGNRTLLIEYLHIPLKSRTKFLSFSHSMLESKLLESIYERNTRVYNTQYLPYLDQVIHDNNTDEKDYSFKTKMRVNIQEDYLKKFWDNHRFVKNGFLSCEGMNDLGQIYTSFYDNFESKFEEYKQKLKQTFYLPIDFEPKNDKTEVKYKKPTTQVGHIETNIKEIKEKLQQKQKDYEEKLRLEKIKKQREEKKKEKEKKKLQKKTKR